MSSEPNAAAPAPASPTDAATQPATASPSAAHVADDPAAGRASIPGYEILGELGRGGMGVVYRARQVKAGRVVALKMILAGAHAGPDELARFRAEAEAAAHLQHPHIVQIYEVGDHAGLPFFSLEYCSEGSLEKRLAGAPLPPAEAAALGETLARAMHAAHQAGVVHRDLKPANILLQRGEARAARTESEAATSASLSLLVPKITDFGLAKRVGDVGRTQSGAVLGTPSYMAPEQAAGRIRDVGPAADVYALGAILYECVTGRPPFKAASTLETLQQVVGQEPAPPRSLQPSTPHDLETICLKCLHKEPARRYASAEDLADDLRRFQAGEPIRARPVGRLERGVKWMRRNPVVALLLAAVVGSLAAGAAAATVFAFDAQRGRKLAEENARQAEEQRLLARSREAEARAQARAATRNLYIAKLQLAQQDWQANRIGRMREQLDEMIPAASQDDLLGFEWRYLDRLTHTERRTIHAHSRPVNAVAVSPDGKLLASGGFDAAVRLWDAASGKELHTLTGHFASVNAVAFSPDGTLLASGGHGGGLRLWRVADGQLLHELKGHKVQVFGVAFSPDGKTLASASADGTARLWDLKEGKEVRKLGDVIGGGRPRVDVTPLGPARPGAHGNMVWAVAFSPDGRTLASTSFDETIKFWEVSTGKDLRTIALNGGYVVGASFSPDGRFLAVATRGPLGSGESGEVALLSVESGRTVTTWRGHQGDVAATAFSPDGLYVASAGADGTIRLWDVSNRRPGRLLRGHHSAVISAAFAPDGRTVVSGGADGTVRVWDALDLPEGRLLPTGDGAALAFSKDSRLLLLGAQGAAELRDPVDGRLLRRLSEPEAQKGPGSTVYSWARAAALRPDGKQIAYLGHGQLRPGVVVLADAEGRTQHLIRGHTEPISALAYTPEGATLLTAGHDRAVKLWDPTDGREIGALEAPRLPVIDLAVDAGGRYAVAVGSATQFIPAEGCELIAWNLADRKVRWRLTGEGRRWRALALHPTAPILAVGEGDGVVTLYSIDDGKELRRLKGHSAGVSALAFSARGDRLATGGNDRTVRLWDWEVGQPVLVLEGQGVPVRSLAFAPNDRVLASSCGGSFLDVNEVRLWEADYDPAERSARYQSPAAVKEWHERASATAMTQQGPGWATVAVFHLTPLLDQAPSDLERRRARGYALIELKRWTEAEADLRRVAEAQPGRAAPLLDLTRAVEAQDRTVAAVRLYTDAFAAEPRAAADLDAYYRYNAACAAARAGVGAGVDAAALSDAEKTALRKQALDWMRSDLRDRRSRATTPSGKAALRRDLTHWHEDTDLVGVRDKAALEKLPEEERKEWRKLWDEAAAALKGEGK